MDFDEADQDNADNEDQEEGGAEQFFDDVVGDAINPDIVSKKDAVIFLIDCQKQLFEKNDQFGLILKSIQSFLKAKIISNVDDKVGLIFYNINTQNNVLKFKGINTIYPLESPSAEIIKKLPELKINFEKQYGFSNQEAKLHEALWLCSYEFKNLDKNKYTMRIFLFTNEDNPNVNDKNERDLIMHHAKQLAEMDVQIELFPLEKGENKKFEIRKFYTEILSFDVDELNNAVLDTTNKIMDLQARMRQKEYKKRTLNRIMMNLGQDVQVGIKLFCSFNRAKKPLGKSLDSNTNKPLKKAVKQYCNETGSILYPNQVGTYCPIGEEKVKISKEEMEKIKEFENPGLRILGFKSKDRLKIYHNFRPSYFIYPDEERVRGSSQLFDALIKQLIIKEKIAIARFIPRKGTQIRFCALIPQQEKYDDDTHFQTPPGFNLIYLPYADDIRDIKNSIQDQSILPSRELVNAAKMLSNCLDLPEFDCRNFEDPALQKFFSHLQAHALREEQPEQLVDLLQPDEIGIAKYEETLELFKEALHLEAGDSNTNDKKKKNQDQQSKPVKKNVQKIEIIKRQKDKNQLVQQVKQKKNAIKDSESEQSVGDYDLNDSFIDDNEDNKHTKKGRKNNQQESDNEDDDMKNEISIIEIEQQLIQGEFKNLKIEDLKLYLKYNKLITTGKKQDLIDRAYNFLSNRNL